MFPKKGLEFIFGRVINVVQKLLFVSIPGNKGNDAFVTHIVFFLKLELQFEKFLD